MKAFLRSRRAFVAVALLVFPPASYALAIYLHDDLKVTFGEPVLTLVGYFAITALLVVALGAITRRTRNEIGVVVIASGVACVLWAALIIIWALTTLDHDPFQ